MIVTSFPRSGSTKFCLDLANSLGYTFYDEVFEISTSTNHKTMGLHEVLLDSVPPKTPAFIKTIDFDKAVFNNHEINYFSLEKTDVFLSRQNVQDAVWSFIAHTSKLIVHQRPDIDQRMLDGVMQLIKHQWFDRLVFYYDYVIENNKTVTIPDLVFPDSTPYREKYSKHKESIDALGTRLRLPSGLEFK